MKPAPVPQSKYKLHHPRRQSKGYVGASIAIADILANSVIVILILIILILNIKEEQSEVESKKQDELSSLISRKIASSIVFNDLPTSRPAYLHDYIHSPIDQNPLESHMPILEFHTDFVRNFYTSETFSYSSLFNKDNGLDRYLSQLSPEQKNRIRIDVYSIKPYYISLSILKDWSIQVRHWHWYGYSQAQAAKQDILSSLKEKESEKGDINIDESRVQQENYESSRADSQLYLDKYPYGGELLGGDDSSELSLEGGKEAAPWDYFAKEGDAQNPESQGSEQNGAKTDTKGSKQTQDALGELSKLKEAWAKFLKGKEGSELSPLQRLLSDLLLKNAITLESNPTLETPGLEREDMVLEAFIASLLQYTHRIEEARLKENQLIDLNVDTFYQSFFLALEQAQFLENFPYRNLVSLLVYKIQAQGAESKAKVVPIALDFNSREASNHFIIPVNTHLDQLKWRLDAKQLASSYLLREENIVHIDLQPYPTITQKKIAHSQKASLLSLASSERLSLARNSLILIWPQQPQSDRSQWRLVTFIEPSLFKFHFGYIYAKVAEKTNLGARKLSLSPDENFLSLNQRNIHTFYSVNTMKHEYLLSIAYVLLSALFLFILFYYGRKKLS